MSSGLRECLQRDLAGNAQLSMELSMQRNRVAIVVVHLRFAPVRALRSDGLATRSIAVGGYRAQDRVVPRV